MDVKKKEKIKFLRDRGFRGQVLLSAFVKLDAEQLEALTEAITSTSVEFANHMSMITATTFLAVISELKEKNKEIEKKAYNQGFQAGVNRFQSAGLSGRALDN